MSKHITQKIYYGILIFTIYVVSLLIFYRVFTQSKFFERDQQISVRHSTVTNEAALHTVLLANKRYIRINGYWYYYYDDQANVCFILSLRENIYGTNIPYHDITVGKILNLCLTQQLVGDGSK